MGIPHTLPGIVGFMILAGFLITSLTNEDSKTNDLQQSMMTSMNQSALSDNSLLGAFNFVSAIWQGVQLLFAYVLSFVGYSGRMPAQFIIFFSLLAVLFVIAIIKLVRGVWDF